MGSGSYTFGDSALAAARLAVLAEVFEEATASFLVHVRDGRQRLVVDLGCGPGFTTLLLDEVVCAERVIGVDSSAAFVEEAAQRLGSRGEVLCADVLDLPAEVRDADLIFARFLLTHLAKPIAAIEYWLDRLSPAGALAVQETESIWTDEPTLTRYLELLRGMLEANGNLLYAGPLIADAGRAHGTVLRDDVARVTPSPSAAARMFAMNFPSWRTRPPVTELASRPELDEIEQGLRALSADDDSDASITWQLREVVVAPGPTTA